MGSKLTPTTNSFDAEQISLILDACARNGVATLKFGNLEVWFGPKAGPPEIVIPRDFALKGPLPPGAVTNYPAQTPSPGDEMPDHEKQEEQSLRQSELALREEQLEELQITDPLAYERVIQNEGLEDADGANGDRV
jgi:hypothetical protein